MYKKILNKLNKNLPFTTKKEIKKRLNEFHNIKKSDNLTWFNELCFCLLTANSRAETAVNIQLEMKKHGFSKKTRTEIKNLLKKHGYRFYNIRTTYILSARKFINIREILQKLDDFEARKFLVKNIKGLGYKEASHFLRNVGYKNLAIIDRHVLKFLFQNKLIKEIPKTITPKKYIEFEKILAKFKIPQNELDLIIWANMTGNVLK